MATVTELVGVYNARGDLLGELSYWVGARLGRAHCALCDITHGTFRRNPDWTRCAEALSVPFTTYHLNDQPPEIRAAAGTSTPCVLARVDDDGVIVIVGPDALEDCAGDPQALATAIDTGCRSAGLTLPA